MRSKLRPVGVALALGGLYTIGALLPFWFLASPDAGAAFFPPAGLTLAALALSPRRWWPLLLVAIATAELSVNLTHDLPLNLALGFTLANTMEPLVGASALRWAAPRYGRTLRGAYACFVVCAVMLGPFVGACIAGATGAIFGSGGSFVGTWWLGDALGVLVIASPILAWARPTKYEPQASLVEIGAITAVSAAVLLVPGLLWHQPMLYLVIPIMMWAAVRGGAKACTLSGVAMAFAADWLAVTGRIENVGNTTVGQHLVFIQFFIGSTLLAALLLSIEIARRTRTEVMLRAAEYERMQAELAATTAAGNERRRIARETHDIVGHALNVMLLQAGAARRVLPTGSEQSRELLESLETAGRSAFRDLDIALGLSEPPPLQPEQGLDAVPELVDTMRSVGLDIELEVERGATDPSTLVEWSTYRILQEALTNVAKHSPSAHVNVSIRCEPEWLFLSVVSANGHSPPRGNGENGRTGRDGRGLIGMRERVAVLGGEIHAGPDATGFVVRVRLPAQGQ